MVFLNIVSTPCQVLSRSRLGLVRFVTRLTQARFGKVDDQVDQAEDQVKARARSLTKISLCMHRKKYVECIF